MLRRPGYRLKPHRDMKIAALTGLIYFARPGDSQEYGTQLYRIARLHLGDRAAALLIDCHDLVGYRHRVVQEHGLQEPYAVIAERGRELGQVIAIHDMSDTGGRGRRPPLRSYIRT